MENMEIDHHYYSTTPRFLLSGLWQWPDTISIEEVGLHTDQRSVDVLMDKAKVAANSEFPKLQLHC